MIRFFVLAFALLSASASAANDSGFCFSLGAIYEMTMIAHIKGSPSPCGVASAKFKPVCMGVERVAIADSDGAKDAKSIDTFLAEKQYRYISKCIELAK